ncbi:UDP-glucose dehydrogenase family protein [Alkalihalobacterium alkalinitrilicum]|uniref:UDP-glucose dehydrogenase family protein n=1 Tax=Alkalihalobacterium alkalinitrilicum TaxID=427920 RepID=UPI000994C2C0|nr:UDP-glucose/GDP-mannose dehydrogenase family protein [Alkalihalobacterium alkalinitrilicum]
MNISVVGTGYVGLVTGVCLAEIGHQVTCIDVNQTKILKLQQGKSPIYEPGLEDLLKRNLENGNLTFTSHHSEGFANADVIYIAVGTPQQEDGTANLSFIFQVAADIARNIKKSTIVVTKSTVPVGTNRKIKEFIQSKTTVPVDVISNPEFLREGSALQDTFEGSRIVIGADSEEAARTIVEINRAFNIPAFITDIESAEMIKYASNAFLATKISFINEIASLCEKLGANVEDVAKGMGMDARIGSQFLKAGIGYGGSCFPKDTKALVQIAGNVEHEFHLLRSVIEVNNKQQMLLVEKAKERFGSLRGLKIALLGLAFKPNTDDMREAASIVIAEELHKEGAEVMAYDPIAIDNAKQELPQAVSFAQFISEAITHADAVFILTEWHQIKTFPLSEYKKSMKNAIIFDGRNCFTLEEAAQASVEYHSIGRKASLSPMTKH